VQQGRGCRSTESRPRSWDEVQRRGCGAGHVVELRDVGDLERLPVTVRLPRNRRISVRVTSSHFEKEKTHTSSCTHPLQISTLHPSHWHPTSFAPLTTESHPTPPPPSHLGDPVVPPLLPRFHRPNPDRPLVGRRCPLRVVRWDCVSLSDGTVLYRVYQSVGLSPAYGVFTRLYSRSPSQ
jgi:hypothetical protein